MTRREFLAAAAISAQSAALPPVRAITKGPKFHWFGYYDKVQFDPSSRFALGMEVGFEHRSPRADDVIRIGMVDTAAEDRWIELGETRAWNWQQGSMLQWLPGSKTEVVWNDRQSDGFVSYVLDVKTRRKRTIPAPIYAVSPDARWAVSPDFRRLNDCRPGYGYAGLPDPNAAHPAPANAGIWRVDLLTGKQDLLISFADILKLDARMDEWAGAKHWFNHLLVSPDGKRFIFLHRWRAPKHGQSWGTRMVTADADGGNLYVVDPHGQTSHFIWRDSAHILAWAWHPSRGNKFYLYEDRTQNVEVVAPDVMAVNGHCTYLPGNRWILNDTYPDKQRNQNPYLYDTKTAARIPLGHFPSPPDYKGEWRCDLHPRFSPDGTKVVIDAPHAPGRQMYLIDIGGLTA
jgi:hypothetical protein